MNIQQEKKLGVLPDVYARQPLRLERGIPVFSEPSEYTRNYEKISEDHLVYDREDGSNPFIPQDLWVQMEQSTIKLIKKYSAPRHMILDVGVGLGRTLAHFPDLQRFGMDISFGYLESAKGKGIEVCYALAEEMPYHTGIFDIIVCTDVLEHVVNLNLCIENILAVLKPKGIVVVRVPYRENLSCYLTTPYKYVHLRNFDEYSVRLLFERIFDCEHLETVFASYSFREALLKYRVPPVRLNFILSKIIACAELVRPPVARRLREKLYYPLEMNVVYRKR
jgi:SAM-dependent methyltransferase